MKLIIYVFCVAIISLFQGVVARDFSTIQAKRITLPRQVNNFQTLRHNLRHYEPHPMLRGTRDMRAEGCGISNPPAANERIVGGWETGVNEFPWQVAFFIDGIYFCSGTLISNEWILTAAHCVDGARSFEIYLGSHNIRVDEPFRTQVNATEYYLHPGWNTFSLRNDVGLIKLPKPVNYTNIIRPICLPILEGNSDHVGEVEILSGWGRSSDSDFNISPVLRKTNATVISNAECAESYDTIYDGNFCVSTVDGHGTCNGDDGGPLSHVHEGDGIFEQIGLFSFGSARGCQVGMPVGFTSVDYFLLWISAITGIQV